MHRVEWSSPEHPMTWTVGDGLLRLPDAVQAGLGASALVLLGGGAALVRPTGLEALDAPATVPCPAGTLSWTPSPAAQSTLPLEATGGSDTPSAGAGAGFQLRIAGAADPIPLPRDELLVVGRHPVCNVRLPDRCVSALHCALRAGADGVRVVDLGSRNGVRLDGTRLQAGWLSRPGVLEVGGSRLILEPVASESAEQLVRLRSAAITRVYELVERVARSGAPVLISGESGVGKEGVARELHLRSGRRGRFVALNAAVLSSELAASELFGHVRGAFTGADQSRSGAFAQADGGTLFLDEVAELRTDVQAELLRVLEERVVRPVGGVEAFPVDVRVVTATHRDLPEQVRRGAFREDLLHRIWVLPLHVAALRERLEDLDVIADTVLARRSSPRRLSPSARARLHAHPWPGNIRELLNVLERACILSDAIELRAGDLEILPPPAPRTQLDAVLLPSVIEAYERNRGSVAATARELGIHRATVYRHLKNARVERYKQR